MPAGRRDRPGCSKACPSAVKDLYCTEGVQTTAGSRILGGFTPPYESTVTAQLWAEGAVNARQDQHGRVRHGLVQHHVPLRPGGESLACGGVEPGAGAGRIVGRVRRRRRRTRRAGGDRTDTGGSIRQPAAFCGIVGMKPTYGRLLALGIVAFASSLDQAGPITRTVRDSAIMLRAMAGHDPKDSTSVPRAVPDYEAALTGTDIGGLRIGIPANTGWTARRRPSPRCGTGARTG